MVGGVTQPPTAGADAVLPARRTPLASLRAGARLALARARARGRLDAAPGVWLAPGARVSVARGASVVLGPGCELGSGTRIEAAAGRVEIDARARLGERTTVAAVEYIEIGEDALIGDWCLLADADPGYEDVERPTRGQPLRTAAVRVGAGARIAAHATLLAGAQVGDGALVGSYALVREAVPPRAVVAGVPARVSSA
jgi:carbonic anhydrase/acetyltransferase-like protein (isoleucine patch superfamily)